MVNLSDVRKKFLERQYTIQNVVRDFHEWHLGRERYAFWAVDVDCPSVRKQVSLARQHFAGLLLEEYCRQPHITLGISGFLTDNPRLADDYGVSNLKADISALQHANIQPFAVEIGTLASFSSAPFFHVYDPGNSLCRLHRCLHSVAGDVSLQYVPHVTTGLYSGAWPTETVSDHLDAFPYHEVIRHRINRISLMSYAAPEIGGKLMTIADYHLDRAEIEWHEPRPF